MNNGWVKRKWKGWDFMGNTAQTTSNTNGWIFSLHIGFFAGLIWGGIRVFFYYFQFTKLLPGFLLEPFYPHSFLESSQGQYLGWIYFILFSMVASLIYTALLSKLRGAWIGIAYGCLWWFLLLAVIGPWLEMSPAINQLDLNSILSELCVFVLWGVFIGYSISFEFTDERKREPVTK